MNEVIRPTPDIETAVRLLAQEFRLNITLSEINSFPNLSQGTRAALEVVMDAYPDNPNLFVPWEKHRGQPAKIIPIHKSA